MLVEIRLIVGLGFGEIQIENCQNNVENEAAGVSNKNRSRIKITS
jgi:hypothetical protein